MLKKLLLTLTAVGIVAGVTATTTFASGGNANQPKTNASAVPIPKTSPTDGKQMYRSYCASCHGVNGQGDGPVGVALRTRPTDLTVLRKNNGGKYPSLHVEAVIQFGSKEPAHGTADMPVWGKVLGKMDMANPQFSQLRISNLSSYLETIQAK